MLVIALVALVGSFILQPSNHGGLFVYVPILRERIELPDTCMSRRVLGISCPGCGLTRSFVAIARGNLQGALAYNPMGPVVFLLVVLQIPYRAIEYKGWYRSSAFWQSVTARLHLVTYALMAALIVAWVIGMLHRLVP